MSLLVYPDFSCHSILVTDSLAPGGVYEHDGVRVVRYTTYQDSHFCSRDIPGASRSELDADCRRFVALYTRHAFAFATRAQLTYPPRYTSLFAWNDHDDRPPLPFGATTARLPTPLENRPSPTADGFVFFFLRRDPHCVPPRGPLLCGYRRCPDA